MKVLIVDDEKHVREAVRYFVPWEKHGIKDIYEATNGQEAIAIILEQQPAIVFTDMRMPLVDGAELLEWLHGHAPHTKTIVISGYQDFNYVKPAIVYGGMDYLLKPLNSRQLIEAAERAFQLWQEEKRERERVCRQNIQLNVLRPLYWDKVLSDLVSGNASFPELEVSLSAEFGMSRKADRCRVAVCSLQAGGCRLLQRFQGDVQLASFVLANVCNEIMAPHRSGYAFRCWQTGVDIAILSWDGVDKIEQQLHQMNESFQRVYGVQMEFGLSRVHAFPQGLQAAFEQARQGLSERNLLHKEGRIHLFREAARASGSEKDCAFQAPLEPLRIALLSGDPERMGRTVDEWAQHLSARTTLTEAGFNRLHEDLRSVFLRRNPEEEVHFELCYDEQGWFSLEGWREQLKAQLLRLTKESRLTQTPDSRLVLEIRDYLDQNYHQEMTLQHIAERFFVSRENISRKYKQVTEENLSDYLTRLRISKAKLLLQNTELRLAQIAELVGYEDEKYFSRVFKKATGQTPRDSRKG
ncbi:hypothetical protein GCM10010912_37930 [Paenibacillus albidus]|uniref:Response regulator n=1 Tax=Paenibacillus albidus TaxID=2041023 RepID=A0A917CK56_9BACL|nr:response regulator [Paenibacillus albidus]GGF89206.1 hypothetical protein GCM10010912_37930 [Paenibacillus albidus]